MNAKQAVYDRIIAKRNERKHLATERTPEDDNR